MLRRREHAKSTGSETEKGISRESESRVRDDEQNGSDARVENNQEGTSDGEKVQPEQKEPVVLWQDVIAGTIFRLVLTPTRVLQSSHIEMQRLISNPEESELWETEWKR